MRARCLKDIASILAVLVVISIAPAPAAVGSMGPQPMATDDEIPGVPLDVYPEVSRTVTGTLDAVPISLPPDDQVDLYSLHLAPGEQLQARLSGSSGADFDLYLFSPDSVTFRAAHEVASSCVPGTASESICYTASRRFGAGRYFLAVVTWNSEGAYELSWHLSGRSDGNIPGRRLTAAVMTGTVDPLRDRDDVYALPLAGGQSLVCTLTSESPTIALDLLAYPPVWNNGGILEPTLDIYHAGDATVDRGTTVVMNIAVPYNRGGTWYLDVRAVSAATAYTLAWEAAPTQVPGRPFPSEVATGTLGERQVWSVPLRWGQRLEGSLWTSPTPSLVNAWLFAPSATSVEQTALAVWSSSWLPSRQPKTSSYTLPSEAAEGVAYLRVDATGTPLFEQRLWRVVSSRRLSGADRYATAVRISQSGFRNGSDAVVIASGEDFPDALSASGLAGAYDAPVLLVRKDTLPEVVRQEIDRLAPTRVFVVGGPGAVSDTVLSRVAARPSVRAVERVSGVDRYATSAEVARRIASRLGPDFGGVAYVARGDTFPDALAVSPLTWRACRPVLLVRSTSVPDAVRAALIELGLAEAVVVGGSAAVSERVFGEIDGYCGVVRRVQGADRYATAAEVAADGVRTGVVSRACIVVATGENFPDALAGGPLCGVEGGVLLLSKRATLSLPAGSFLAGSRETVEVCRLLGGTGALAETVRSAVDAALVCERSDAPPVWW